MQSPDRIERLAAKKAAAKKTDAYTRNMLGQSANIREGKSKQLFKAAGELRKVDSNGKFDKMAKNTNIEANKVRTQAEGYRQYARLGKAGNDSFYRKGGPTSTVADPYKASGAGAKKKK